MPNIKSSKKDVLSSKIAYEKNKSNKSELKTTVKKFDAAGVRRQGCCRGRLQGCHSGCGQGCDQGYSAQEYCCPQEEQHDPEAEQAGLISLKISPSEPSLEGVFSFYDLFLNGRLLR